MSSSSTDQFWQYAKEALLLAVSAESDDDRQSLLELSRTWTRAAIVERQLCTQAKGRLGWRPYVVSDHSML
jgi:hypothetical protein